MTAPSPQPEYIITEEQLRHLFWEETDEDWEIVKAIRSRPIQSPIPNDEQFRICLQSEREKVLDAVIQIINKNCFELEGKRLKVTPLLLMQEIDSLRSSLRSREP